MKCLILRECKGLSGGAFIFEYANSLKYATGYHYPKECTNFAKSKTNCINKEIENFYSYNYKEEFKK